MKKKIYIEINNILRNINSKTIQVYKADNLEHELPEEYNGEDLQEFLNFETKEDLLEYMYVECPMRIFGYSNECEEGGSLMINEFYKKYRDKHHIVLFSNEIEKSKPATLMFLARIGVLIDNIEFYGLEDFETVNKKADIIITNNKNFINNSNVTYIQIKQKESEEKNKNIFQIPSIKNLVEHEYIERNELD